MPFLYLKVIQADGTLAEKQVDLLDLEEGPRQVLEIVKQRAGLTEDQVETTAL